MPQSGLIEQSGSRVERKRARNREALVGAARRLFAAGGFDATTIADIAEAADLGFGTFYRYFEDKEAILQAVLDEGRLEIDAVLVADPASLTATEALTQLSARFVRAVRRNHDVLVLMWQLVMREGPRGRAGAALRDPEQALPLRLANAMSRLIQRGIDGGEFPAGDADLLARLLSNAHMYLFWPSAQEMDEASLIKTLCEFELRALGVQAADERQASQTGGNSR